MAEKKKTVFFSIEIAARELMPKCLLALETAKSGMRVYIGSFRALKQLDGRIDECIFFHKSTWTKNAARLRKTIGAHFVFLDEEMGLALPRSELKSHLTARFKHVNAQDYRHSFAIGEMHKDCMETLDVFKGVEVHALGWPRLDLWRESFHELYKSDVEQLQQENGNFYLLVSSFGTISESTYKEGVRQYVEEFNLNPEVFHFNYKHFKSCLKLIDELSPKLKDDESLIVRPHTSESLEEWERLLEDYPNVHIRHEGDITPWLLASKGTIQFGSTVAVQAACMGVPSIQLHNDKEVPGVTDTPSFETLKSAQSADEVIHFLRDSATHTPTENKQKAITKLEGLASSMEGPLASTRIAEFLQGIDVKPQGPIRYPWPRRFVLWFKERINYMNYMKSKLLQKERVRLKRSKFEKIPNGLTAQEIGDHLEKLAHILGDDPKRIHCRQVAHNLVEIEYN
jgi:surface carbohydrate biosynthesis protein